MQPMPIFWAVCKKENGGDDDRLVLPHAHCERICFARGEYFDALHIFYFILDLSRGTHFGFSVVVDLSHGPGIVFWRVVVTSGLLRLLSSMYS
jgi:hypothetical protein